MGLITLLYLLLSAICLTLILLGLHYGINQSNLDENRKKPLFRKVVVILGTWLVAVSILAIQGFFKDFSSFPPKITLTLIPPMIFWLILTIRSKTLKMILDRVPVHWIIYLQSFRVAVELILWRQFVEGLTPIQMTFEGRNFDVLAGLTAIVVGYIYSKKGYKIRKLAIAWNFFGLALLINILMIAILSFPTKIRYFMNEPANTLVAEFPVVLLPAFLVMIAYTMHFFSLKQLLSKS